MYSHFSQSTLGLVLGIKLGDWLLGLLPSEGTVLLPSLFISLSSTYPLMVLGLCMEFPIRKYPSSFLYSKNLINHSKYAQLLQSCLTLCNLWTVTHQAPLSMGFSRQEYWSGLPCPPQSFKTKCNVSKTTEIEIFSQPGLAFKFLITVMQTVYRLIVFT